jgi:hypothetical protein
MRWLVVFVAVCAGCVASLPTDDAAITADLAAETAREVIRLRQQVAPTPVPPAPGGQCDNCEGRGYVGDGTVRVKCQPCNGTGKR